MCITVNFLYFVRQHRLNIVLGEIHLDISSAVIIDIYVCNCELLLHGGDVRVHLLGSYMVPTTITHIQTTLTSKKSL